MKMVQKMTEKYRVSVFLGEKYRNKNEQEIKMKKVRPRETPRVRLLSICFGRLLGIVVKDGSRTRK